MPKTDQELLEDQELRELCTADVRLLRSFPMEERFDLVRHAEHKRFRKNSVIFREGDPVNAIFVIKNGTVKLSTYDSEGREQIIGVFGKYDTIWEGLFMDGSTYPFSGTCLTSVDVCIITKEQFEEKLENPAAAKRIIRMLSRKLHDANERNKILSTGDPTSRIAGFLLYQVEHSLDEVMTLTLGDIAASTNLRPETVSRKLKALERDGAIAREGQSGIRVLDYHALKELYEL